MRRFIYIIFLASIVLSCQEKGNGRIQSEKAQSENIIDSIPIGSDSLAIFEESKENGLPFADDNTMPSRNDYDPEFIQKVMELLPSSGCTKDVEEWLMNDPSQKYIIGNEHVGFFQPGKIWANVIRSYDKLKGKCVYDSTICLQEWWNYSGTYIFDKEGDPSLVFIKFPVKTNNSDTLPNLFYEYMDTISYAEKCAVINKMISHTNIYISSEGGENLSFYDKKATLEIYTFSSDFKTKEGCGVGSSISELIDIYGNVKFATNEFFQDLTTETYGVFKSFYVGFVVEQYPNIVFYASRKALNFDRKIEVSTEDDYDFCEMIRSLNDAKLKDKPYAFNSIIEEINNPEKYQGDRAAELSSFIFESIINSNAKIVGIKVGMGKED